MLHQIKAYVKQFEQQFGRNSKVRKFYNYIVTSDQNLKLSGGNDEEGELPLDMVQNFEDLVTFDESGAFEERDILRFYLNLKGEKYLQELDLIYEFLKNKNENWEYLENNYSPYNDVKEYVDTNIIEFSSTLDGLIEDLKGKIENTA